MDLFSLSNDLQTKVPNIRAYPESGKTVRVDIATNNVNLRNKVVEQIKTIYSGATTLPARPHDVLLPGGWKVLVKPAQGAKKTGSKAYYGYLDQINLSLYNMSAFKNVSGEVASKQLPSNIKEASDVKCVSDLNELIFPKLKQNPNGIAITVFGYKFTNIVGCVPVTEGEPKADVVLVQQEGKILRPVCFLSYKMGSNAKGFQNYSGLSEKSSPFIFNHPETVKFYQEMQTLAQHGGKVEHYQLIEDPLIKGKSVFGMDYPSSKFGVNNCHAIVQGEPSLSGSALKYTHMHKNGDMAFEKEYDPVFGSRTASGRGNVGPKGVSFTGYRIGIYPRAFRSAWL